MEEQATWDAWQRTTNFVVETGPFSEQKNREQVKVGGAGLHFRVRDFSKEGEGGGKKPEAG